MPSGVYDRGTAKRASRKLSEQGRLKLSKAMKARWAAKRRMLSSPELIPVIPVTEPKIYASRAQRSEVVPTYSLIPAFVLRRLAQRYALGKENYGEFNYLTAVGDREFILGVIDHMQEHLMRFLAEGTKGDDHLAAMMWAGATLMVFEQHNPELLKLIHGPREEAIREGLAKGHKRKSK